MESTTSNPVSDVEEFVGEIIDSDSAVDVISQLPALIVMPPEPQFMVEDLDDYFYVLLLRFYSYFAFKFFSVNCRSVFVQSFNFAKEHGSYQFLDIACSRSHLLWFASVLHHYRLSQYIGELLDIPEEQIARFFPDFDFQIPYGRAVFCFWLLPCLHLGFVIGKILGLRRQFHVQWVFTTTCGLPFPIFIPLSHDYGLRTINNFLVARCGFPLIATWNDLLFSPLHVIYNCSFTILNPSFVLLYVYLQMMQPVFHAQAYIMFFVITYTVLPFLIWLNNIVPLSYNVVIISFSTTGIVVGFATTTLLFYFMHYSIRFLIEYFAPNRVQIGAFFFFPSRNLILNLVEVQQEDVFLDAEEMSPSMEETLIVRLAQLNKDLHLTNLELRANIGSKMPSHEFAALLRLRASIKKELVYVTSQLGRETSVFRNHSPDHADPRTPKNKYVVPTNTPTQPSVGKHNKPVDKKRLQKKLFDAKNAVISYLVEEMEDLKLRNHSPYVNESYRSTPWWGTRKAIWLSTLDMFMDHHKFDPLVNHQIQLALTFFNMDPTYVNLNISRSPDKWDPFGIFPFTDAVYHDLRERRSNTSYDVAMKASYPDFCREVAALFHHFFKLARNDVTRNDFAIMYGIVFTVPTPLTHDYLTLRVMALRRSFAERLIAARTLRSQGFFDSIINTASAVDSVNDTIRTSFMDLTNQVSTKIKDIREGMPPSSDIAYLMDFLKILVVAYVIAWALSSKRTALATVLSVAALYISDNLRSVVPQAPLQSQSPDDAEFGSAIATLMTTGVVAVFNLPKLTKPDMFIKEFTHIVKLKENFAEIASSLTIAISKVVSYVREQLFDQEPIRVVKSDIPAIDDWLSRAHEMYLRDRNYQSSGTPMTAETADDLLALQTEGVRLLSIKLPRKIQDQAFRQISATQQFLSKMQNRYDRFDFRGESLRQEPVMIYIAGPPGLGKSAAIIPLMLAIAARIMEPEEFKRVSKNHKDLFYNRQIEHQYADGYRGQFFVTIDDFQQLIQAVGGTDNAYMDLIRMMNLFEHILHTSHVDEKGKSVFRSKVVICNSNSETISTDTITHPAAVIRRMDLPYMLFVSDKYSKDHVMHDGTILPGSEVPHAERTLDTSGMVPGEYYPEAWCFYPYTLTKDGSSKINFSKPQTMDQVLESVVTSYRLKQLKHAGLTKLVKHASSGQQFADFKPPLKSQGRFKKQLEAGSDLATVDKVHKCLQIIGPLLPEPPVDEWLLSYCSTACDLISAFGPSQSMDWSGFYVWLETNAAEVIEDMRHPTVYDVFHFSLVTFLREALPEFLEERTYWERCKVGAQEAYQVAIQAIQPHLSKITIVTFLLVGAGIVKTAYDCMFQDQSRRPDAKPNNRNPRNNRGPPQLISHASGASIDLERYIVYNNFVSFGWARDDGLGDCFGGGLFIKKNFLLFNYHYVEIIKRGLTEPDVQGIWVSDFARETYYIVPCSSFASAIELGEETDVAIAQIPIPNWKNYRDITKHLNTGFREGVDKIAIAVRLPSQDERFVTYGEFMDRPSLPIDEGKDRPIRHMIRYIKYTEVPTVPGDCGGLIFATHSSVQCRLIGQHSAGNTKVSIGSVFPRDAILAYIRDQETKEQLQSQADDSQESGLQSQDAIMETLKSKGFSVVGTIEPYPSSPGISNIIPSRFGGFYDDNGEYHESVFPSTKKPARLRPYEYDGVAYDPLLTAILKYAPKDPDVDDDIMEATYHSVHNHLINVSNQPKTRRILTPEEAVYGTELIPLKCPDRGTSCGYPWNVATPPYKKVDFFPSQGGFGSKWPVLRDSVEKLVRECATGSTHNYSAIFTDFPKDETLPREKVDAGKVRLISACPIHLLLAVRMYFSAWTNWLMENRIVNSMSLGVDEVADGRFIALDLQRVFGAQFCIPGDFSGFDTSMFTKIMMYALRHINAWYSDAHSAIREEMFKLICRSVHIFRGILYIWIGSNPSGQPMTTELNDFINIFLFVYVFTVLTSHTNLVATDFWSHVALQVGGDDNIGSVDDSIKDIYNAFTIRDEMAKIGYRFTPPSKGEVLVPYQSLSECEFLGRGFTPHFFLHFARPLRLSSLQEAPLWTKRDMSSDKFTYDTIEQMSLEAALHGEEYFNFFTSRIVARCRLISFPMPKYTDFKTAEMVACRMPATSKKTRQASTPEITASDSALRSQGLVVSPRLFRKSLFPPSS